MSPIGRSFTARFDGDNRMRKFIASPTCSRKRLYGVILAVELLFLTPMRGQWQYAGLGSYVVDIRSVGNQLIAATEYSVFRSTNDGVTWDTLASPTISSINSVEVIDSIMLVGAYWGCADCLGSRT